MNAIGSALGSTKSENLIFLLSATFAGFPANGILTNRDMIKLIIANARQKPKIT